MTGRKNRKNGGRAGSKSSISRSWLVWGGAAVAAAAILIVLTVSRSRVDGENSSGSSADRIAAPDFPLTLYQGAAVLGNAQLEFSDVFNQGKPVVLNFWAGLCPPCRAEMPGFQNMYDELGDQFILVGLDIGPYIRLGSNEDGRDLLGELNITYPAGTTFEASTVSNYRVRGMPTTVFLTADGEILETHTGLLDEASFRNKVLNLIQASGAS